MVKGGVLKKQNRIAHNINKFREHRNVYNFYFILTMNIMFIMNFIILVGSSINFSNSERSMNIT